MDEELEKREKYLAYRRARVKRIKTYLILLLIVLLIIPDIFSIYLLTRIKEDERKLDDLIRQFSIAEEIAIRNKVTYTEVQENPIVEEEPVPEVIEEGEGEYVIPSDSELYPDKKLIYLTFDDGPSYYTDTILDILESHGVKATFFLLAKEGYDQQYRRILDGGHTMAIHSYTHKYEDIYDSVDSFRQDVLDMSDFLYDRYGCEARFYRFPGGSSNQVAKVPKKELLGVIKEADLIYVDWNVSSGDASSKKLTADKIYENVIGGVQKHNSSVVLMHDASDKSTTVEALPMIIEKLQEDENVMFLPITEGSEFARHAISVSGEE